MTGSVGAVLVDVLGAGEVGAAGVGEPVWLGMALGAGVGELVWLGMALGAGVGEVQPP